MWGGAAGRDLDFFADSVRIGRLLRLEGPSPGTWARDAPRFRVGGSVRRRLANVPGSHGQLTNQGAGRHASRDCGCELGRSTRRDATSARVAFPRRRSRGLWFRRGRARPDPPAGDRPDSRAGADIVAPANGASVSEPFNVSWTSVTSNPSGVIAYNWQVSTSSTMTPVVYQHSVNSPGASARIGATRLVSLDLLTRHLLIGGLSESLALHTPSSEKLLGPCSRCLKQSS